MEKSRKKNDIGLPFVDVAKIGRSAGGKSVCVSHIMGHPYLCVKDGNDIVAFMGIETVKKAVALMDIVYDASLSYHRDLLGKNVEKTKKEKALTG